MRREDIVFLVAALTIITAMVASLKLAGVLDWSWLFVFAPPVACVVLAAVILRRP